MSSKTQRRLLSFLSDLTAFVHSQEVNKAFSEVTVTNLIQEQIKRNGDTLPSNSSQFNPYAFDATAEKPASEQNLDRANYLSGSDVNLPTRLERLAALKFEMEDMIAGIKALPLSEITDKDVDDDSAQDGLVTDDPLTDVIASMVARNLSGG